MSESTVGNTETEGKRDIIFGACHHNIKKISQLVSECDSVFNLSLTSRRCSTFDQWLCWSSFVSIHGGRMELKRHLRMSLTSFEKLLSFIRKSLEVDSAMVQLRGGVIIPEIALYYMLCYLAGGLYTIFLVYPNLHSTVWYGTQCTPLSDVKSYELNGRIPKNWLCRVRLSKPSFYRVVWNTMYTIV